MNEIRLNAKVADLNSEQQDAVAHIVGGWRTPDSGVRLTIVDGPPGTGKTHISAVAAGEWVRNHDRQVVLFTPTHRAAERAQSALVNVGFEPDEAPCLAPGFPEQPKPGLITFDRAENLPPPLRRQLRQARVLVTTWQGSQRALDFASNFLLLFDEVSQISFSAFMSLLYSVYRRAIPAGYALIGDPYQLPVVTTQDTLAVNAALGVLRRHPECKPHRLISQYRMNKPICDVVNEVRRVAFGGKPLQPANDSIAQRTLDQVTGYYRRGTQFDDILNPFVPVVFVDTTCFATECGWEEEGIGGSWAFEPEAHLAIRLAEAIKRAYKISPTDQVIIAPYRAQMAKAQALGASNPITFHRAQGHEWECVILTLGRTKVLGRTILDEVYQYIYVGLSRAKSKLIVLLNVNLFHQFRLFAALLNTIPTIPGVRLVKAEPAWGEE